jgi:hypothetical protein
VSEKQEVIEARREASGWEAALRDHWVTALLVVSAFAVCWMNLAKGHIWGDDFALYIGQAAAVTDFNLDAVVRSNVYAIEYSSWSTFSPVAYPWGYPLLIAPLYAIWGINYGAFQLLQCVFFAAFVGLLHRIFVPRVRPVAGTLLVLLIGSSVVYVGWAQSVTADFPFIAFVALTLLLLDRARRAGISNGVGLRLLVLLGLVAAFATNIRREGIVLFFAIAVVQLAALVSDRLEIEKQTRPRFWRNLPLKRLATPYVAGLALIGAFEAIFPGPFANSYSGTGLGQLRGNSIWFRDVLAQIVGLTDVGTPSLRYGGSEILAKWMLSVFLIAAVIGIVARLIRGWREDAAIAGYLAAVIVIVGSLPFHEVRYLFTIVPFLIYFAYQGVREAVRLAAFRIPQRQVLASVTASLFILALLVPNVADLRHRTGIRLGHDTYVMWGPADPSAEEMFARVRSVVPEGDVVAFFRGRAMTLLGERQGLYLTVLDQILERADWYAMQKNSTYSQYALGDAEAAVNGITSVWENNRFVLWKVP